ncbi:hypothetical protein EHI8A_009130 [Entamoeba histolytica HM-1:IMSS-B]|uniref:Uncharacterized protein n=6 Tax=Entamoeba histolytica TaxID=5759 RepID=C4M3P5_ENTH1|nr:hypothetical protein EHI_140730 [Entamoeba histolytica HM-1:IMSS]EMD42957.1 Hypothetical protein EHI5A_025950 [Entamoeba histolytica KU27]EMH76889.1 hypothetical protein EHI8A_009130 [Entamoeba histolytica HM-1:IMSS-B]EMS17500.1 hypothetical protein KM1_027340 [Entamoeba histolytica HM-3:IMSS]ENY61235.1 hypothetical protein EHI7A_011960 [Entamoeba histolytica HM-1:IMSS-A]GAT95947.1 hypothetical protein CL6EHI_140730 [Entamoeba histolytica]|eukprot:XP_654201.1 hypothetical protein EHI_140730 [Entamoeba histolytica HM-1:IMSS]
MNRSFVTFVKMYLLSIPDIDNVLKGSYEKVFSCKSIEEMFITLSPLLNKYYRDESIPYEQRYNLFSRIQLNRYDTPLKCNPLYLLDEKSKNCILQAKSNFDEIHKIVQNEVDSHRCSPHISKDLFDAFLASSRNLEQLECIPITDLLEPLGCIGDRQYSFKKNKMENTLLRLLENATPEQLQRVVQLIQTQDNFDGVDLSFSIESLDLITLHKLILLF